MNFTGKANAAGLRTTPGIAFTWGISKSVGVGGGQTGKKKWPVGRSTVEKSGCIGLSPVATS